ncbi:MAG: class II aldolase/adducin family protein, partial [Bdellovibrionales bacterium]|nr:class II aldolase/adducin family protein [Bdellovibrionales bacterium]
MKTALVVGGGTSEFVDDVRLLTNISTGSFAVELARTLQRRGIQVTFLGSRKAIRHHRDALEGIRCVEFVTVADLSASLEAESRGHPDFLFMAAAVSDYSPVRETGKIRSDGEELLIRCVRTPKLLDKLREWCGRTTFIVGFKLLSGVSPDELARVALQQTTRTRINLTVANDLREIDFARGLHPVFLVTPEGGAIRVEGHRVDVIRELVEFSLRRADVRWFRTEMDHGVAVDVEATHAAPQLLALGQSMGLYSGTSGNVSHRVAPGSAEIFVTPRQVDKAALRASDFCRASTDLATRVVRGVGRGRTSIDTGMQLTLYHELPEIAGLLHFHGGFGLFVPDCSTAIPHPCGTMDEAEEILAARQAALCSWSNPYSGGDFLVHLTEHGYLLALGEGGVERLRTSWDAMQDEYRQHLVAVGAPEDGLTLHPVFVGARLVG